MVAISAVGEACQGMSCSPAKGTAPLITCCSPTQRAVNEDAVAHVVAGCNCCQNPTDFFYEAAGQAKASLEYLVRAVHTLETDDMFRVSPSLVLRAYCPVHVGMLLQAHR